MASLMRTCPVFGCPTITGGGRCDVHSTSKDPRSARNHRGVSRHDRGHGAAFDRQVKALQGQPCALRLPGCTGVATSGDYPVPLSRGGSVDQVLQPACLHCQRAQGASLARGR